MTLGANSVVGAFLAVGGCTGIFNSNVLIEDRKRTVSVYTIQSSWRWGHAGMCVLICPFPSWLWDWSLYEFCSVLICCCCGGGGEEFVSVGGNLMKKIVTRDIMTLIFHKVIETENLKILKNMASVSSYKLHPLLYPATKLYYRKSCMSIILFD